METPTSRWALLGMGPCHPATDVGWGMVRRGDNMAWDLSMVGSDWRVSL